MLYDDPILQYRGLTIYRDFSDKRTYYYLPPEAPRIARSAEGVESGDYAMRLVLFRHDPAKPPPVGMENGGGFLNLDTDLHIGEALRKDAEEEIRRRFGADANLVPVPFTEGSVELVLLGVNRDDQNQPFVRKMAGSTVPSLYGSQRAAFSNVLDHNGAALMKAVIEEGGATMALAIYHLTYVGIGPAYNLKITVDFDRVYEHLDLRINAGISAGNSNSRFVAKAGFHMLMEELKESRAIKVEEVDPIPGENGRTPTNQAAINEIIADLMGSKWFKPTLATAGTMTNLPAPPAGTGGSGTGGTSGSTTPAPAPAPATPGQRENAQWHKDSETPTPFPDDRGVEAFQPSASGTREALTIRGSGATARIGPSAEALQAHPLEGNRLLLDVAQGATQHVEIKWPASETTTTTPGERRPATWTGPTAAAGEPRGVEPFEPSSSGTSETLMIRGDGATAKVGAAESALAPADVRGNRLVVDFPDGESRIVEIVWPAAAGEEEMFHLFFDYDRPTDDAGDMASYNNRNPNPAEPAPAPANAQGSPPQGEQDRFLAESRSATSGTARGPAALAAWLDTLEPGSSVTLDAHSSYEGDDSPEKRAFNQRLSQRRLDVAQHLIGGVPTTHAVPHGHADARNGSVATLGDDNEPANSRGGKPQDRVVLIRGRKRGGTDTVVRGQLRRERAGSGSQTRPESILRGHIDRGASNRGGDDATKIEASFEVNLEMIERHERITATYELSTRKARKQTKHPQGQLVLDAIDPKKYVLEADGAIDFFQWLEIAASTTAQWEQDGVHSIQVQLRYAPNGQGGFQRSGEINLTPAQQTGQWKVGVLHDNADDDAPVVFHYDYKVIVNYTQEVALGNQQGAMSSIGTPRADADGWIRSDARNLVIHPRDVTPAITVNVATGVLQYDLLTKAQLVISYGPYRQNVELSADKKEHRLVIRPEPELLGATLRTEGTLFYKDMAQVPLPPHDWQPQELVVINEPRENILRVRVLLADPADEYEQVIAELRYEHGNRVVEQPYTLKDHAEMKEWAVRLEDPAQRGWRWKATLIKKSGDIDNIDWTDGRNDQLILGVQAVDVIPVQVTWLLPLPIGDLVAVKVDLDYEDAPNEVHWTRSELIRQGHGGTFNWAVPIKDMRRRGYRYRVTEFRATGMSEGPWRDSDARMLVLVPGG